ncbi:Cof-type HAD-IIB family hydrolase [Mesomycoplasma dispar]|uniref:HAD family hydrolase n=1 Tax=Mesomycoplasma dispar TaxID=86660 RepID=A0ABM6PRE4_9BACT|nr:Cof-type HAD-IIB family hydrolase [Mesomycoplasma dispar]ATP59802.1 hypothetical protein CSW10_02595 [Mesomycoplasma dispar]
MNKKLIFSDIDGTLYCADFKVSEQTTDYIKKNKDKFILVLNTGNPLSSRIRQVAKNLEIRYVITSNGALFSDLEIENHQLINGSISTESQKYVFEIAKNLDMQLNFWNQEKYFSFNTKREYFSFFNYPHLDPENEVHFTDSFQENVIKLELIGSPAQIEKAYKLLEKDQDLEVVFLKNLSLEISKKNTNKGNAVEFVSNALNYKIDEVMTIGDSPNDVSMLERTKFSYAMANGYEAVKKTANFHTSACDQEGLIYAIKDFLYRTKFN